MATACDPTGRIITSTWFSPRICWAVGIIFALASGLLYWVISLLLQPNQPLEIAILYRFGDTDYLNLFYAAARFRFHEFITEGIEPPRIVPFPYGLAYVYGIPIMLFGDAGFVVGDAAVSIARMAVCMLLARPFTRTPAAGLAAAIVLFALTGPLPGVSRVWTMFMHPLWDLRITRPFVSGLCALAVVYTTWRIDENLTSPRTPYGLCLTHGALIGLIVQGDLHTGIIASIVTAGIGLAHLARTPKRLPSILFRGALVAASCALVVAPMVYQVSQAHPDVLQRLGQIPMARTAPPLLIGMAPLAEIIVLTAILGIVRRWRIGGDQAGRARHVLSIAGLYALAALVAVPLSVVMLGKGIQIYHFAFRADGFAILGFTLVVLLAFRSLPPRPSSRTVALAGLVMLGPLHLAFIGYRSIGQATTEFQQRSWNSGWAPIPGYRTDLIALWQELSRSIYADASVLGTFDHQLGMLWASRERHRLWLPDTFLSTVPNVAIERRLVAFAQHVGMSQTTFAARVPEEYFYNHIINGMRWHASRHYMFSDPTQYNRDDQHRIASSDWSTIAPTDEVSRLLELFRNPTAIDGRLDIIVLNRRSNVGDLPGPTGGYSKTYENESFTVWLKSP